MKANSSLRHEREVRGWSQGRLAELIGVDRITLGRWERGEVRPYPYFREKLCTLFNKNAQELGFLLTDADTEDTRSLEESEQDTTVSSQSTRLYDPTTPPLPAAHLIGRDALLLHIEHQLCTAHTPLLAFYGLPGVGKTALATQLAHRPHILECFPDGVLWAGLGPQTNITAHLSRWARLLDIHTDETQRLQHLDEWVPVLRAAIGLRRMLLIIDDVWENEMAQAFRVAGPHCATILTTRFPPLAVHFAGHEAMKVPELDEQESIALFTHYVPDLNVAHMNVAHEIVAAASGLPLSLTLMGKYVQMQGYSKHPRRQQAALERFRDAEERLRIAVPSASLERSPSLSRETPFSLQATIVVSIQLLEKHAQDVFSTLAVFPAKPNSFSEEAALAICGESTEMLDLFSDMGLLESSEQRYMLHQAIADYARVFLPEQTDVHSRMVRYYLPYLQVHQNDVDSLEQENTNVLAALDIAYEKAMLTELVQGILAFLPYLRERGFFAVAKQHVLQAYTLATTQHDEGNILLMQYSLGEITTWQSDYIQAQSYLEAGLALARQAGDVVYTGMFLSQLGFVMMQRGDNMQAEKYLHEGLALMHDREKKDAMSELFRHLGLVSIQQENLKQAEQYFQQGLHIARQFKQSENMPNLLINLATVLEWQRDFQRAEEYYQEALTLVRQSGSHEQMAILLEHVGQVACQKGEYAQAEACFQEGLAPFNSRFFGKVPKDGQKRM